MKNRTPAKLLLLSLLAAVTVACGSKTDATGGASESAEASQTAVEESAQETEESTPEEEPSEAATSFNMANPWKPTTEQEAAELVPYLFRVPEGATNISWTMLRDTSDPKVEYPETTVQLEFDLDGMRFTAREQYYGESTKDNISGMYYQWTSSEDVTLANWASGQMKGKVYRYVGEDECVDLCTWMDVETGAVYSLGVSAKDLDGFDIQAVAESMYDPDKEITE